MSELRRARTPFLGSGEPDDDAAIGIIGVPYDAAVTYRGGANQGPTELRIASDSIESYCPKLDMDLEDLGYADLGDIVVDPEDGPRENMAEISRLLERLPHSRLLAIGGDHLVAYPFLRRALERYDDLQIIHIDAHWDLREHWQGEPFNHASVIRLILEHLGQEARIHSWGIRSGLRSEYAFARGHEKISLLNIEVTEVLRRVQALFAQGRPMYLTLDVDGLDPSEIPGTGTPEPDGLRFRDVEALLHALSHTPTQGPGLVGADIVELAPVLDPSGRSNVAVARLARGMLMALAAHA